MRKRPASVDTTVRTAPVLVSVAFTVAPGIVAPVLSTIVPVSVPVPPPACAKAVEAPARQSDTTTIARTQVRRTLSMAPPDDVGRPFQGRHRGPERPALPRRRFFAR